MQLVFAVVQREDADFLCRRLNARGFRVTRIASSGGFLSMGNVTVLLGVEDAQVPEVVAIVRQNCRARRTYVNPLPWGGHLALPSPTPLEVEIGGATVFTIPVRQFMLPCQATPLTVVPPAETDAAQDFSQTPTDLILAILSPEDSESVESALLRAGYRLTRMPTVGAFLRRGNLTLLAAVPRPSVHRALTIIRENCSSRQVGDARSTTGAVFVVELAEFVHLPGQEVPF